MKKFLKFIAKIATFFAFISAIFYCIGHFFTSKTQRINELFSKKDSQDE